MEKFAKFYRKVVVAITTFFTCFSGVFLLAGTGAPGVRVLVGLIFFISLLNLSVYARDLVQAARACRPGGVKPDPPAQGGKPGGGQGQGGGQNGGNNGGQGNGKA